MPDIIQTCSLTKKEFIVDEFEQDFYKKMEVPLPTLCPQERMRRRLAFRNERHLYHRKCDLTGKQIISSASQDKSYPVYDIDAWWSDKWDALDHGQDYDFSRPFFDQFYELMTKVPRLALQQQKPIENSDYCNCASRNKNCYLVFSTNYCEDCYYGSWINYSKNCIDNSNSLHNELCYETVDCTDCYNVIYAEESSNCIDCAFIKNCTGSKNCLFSTGLRNAEYHIFNKKVSKEDYEKFKSELDLGSHQKFQAAIKEFEKLKKHMVVKSYFGVGNEAVTGNYMKNCNNCKNIYECFHCQDVRYANNLEVNVKDCMDFSYWGSNANLIYECQACGYDIYNLRFCTLCWSNCNNLTYCNHTFSSENCFGCIGLKKKKFCILNKQYTEEEYNKLVPKIIEHMKSTGEWGEFFPVNKSYYAYNETLANEWFPLTKEQALERGYSWKDPDELNDYNGPTNEIAEHINNVDPNILNQILTCEVTGKNYKIIPQELEFYKKMNLPIPRKCPNERHKDRIKRRNPRELWDRDCQRCHRGIKTSYSPKREEKVYCEECYLNEVY